MNYSLIVSLLSVYSYCLIHTFLFQDLSSLKFMYNPLRLYCFFSLKYIGYLYFLRTDKVRTAYNLMIFTKWQLTKTPPMALESNTSGGLSQFTILMSELILLFTRQLHLADICIHING